MNPADEIVRRPIQRSLWYFLWRAGIGGAVGALIGWGTLRLPRQAQMIVNIGLCVAILAWLWTSKRDIEKMERQTQEDVRALMAALRERQ